MAVSSTFTLPGQPAVGTSVFIPLGGDGFSAPQSAYAIQNQTLTGDGSGGVAALQIVLDDRFTSLVSYVTLQDNQVSSADADVRMAITFSDTYPQLVLSQPVVAISKTVSGQSIAITWNPPAVLMPGAGQVATIDVRMVNVSSDAYTISALIYCFNIRARELTPMGPLLWARGST